MKIALVILHAEPSKGGAETYTIDLARALADRGHHVSMLASSFVADLDARIERVAIPHAGPTRLARYVRFLDELDAHLSATRYDVVHAMLPVRRCDLYHPHAGIAAEAVSAGHEKHSSPLKRTFTKLANRFNRKRQRFAAVERELLLREGGRAAPTVICLSEYIKATVLRHYPLPAEKLATLINAVDLKRFDPANVPTSGITSEGWHGLAYSPARGSAASLFTASETVDETHGQRSTAAHATLPERSVAGRATREQFGIRPDQVVALIVAQDFARKGLAEAIAAWKRIADDRLVLLVVGKDDFAPYARLADGSAFPKNLVYAGATRDVRPFYAAADCFVLPTRHDPCSLVVLEALAMGLPVISTRFNGACEVMTEGTHGFVLPDPGDVDVLTNAMRRMLDDSSRRAMHEACIALRPRLAYEHHVEELVRLYARAKADLRSSG